MDGSLHDTEVRISLDSLARLMPMHLCLAADGSITGHGPTMGKLMSDSGLTGGSFFDLFEVRRPGNLACMDDLVARAGQRLHMVSRRGPGTAFRGIAMPLGGGAGMVMNLSFGIAVADAVRDHGLTDADFAPTDLAVELLYLIEAKTAVMTELRALNLRLEGAKTAAEEQALTDTLTGLRNRRALDHAMTRTILWGTAFGLMHIDLDYFKAVNDTMGHAAGDHVLRAVARTLREHTRSGDTVARVGGDEFVILLPGLTDPLRLHGIADRIIAGLNRPILFEGQPCRISASIGMAVSTDYDPVHPDRIQSDADLALYESKRSGRGRATMHIGGQG